MKLNEIEVEPYLSSYLYGGISLLLKEKESGLIFTIVTKYLPVTLSNDNCAFIDTNNNGEGIIQWLIKNNFGELTGTKAQSGFCLYPEFDFTKYINMCKNEEIKEILR